IRPPAVEMESRPSRSLARMTAGKGPSRGAAASSVAIFRRSFTSWRIWHIRRKRSLEGKEQKGGRGGMAKLGDLFRFVELVRGSVPSQPWRLSDPLSGG